jgi:hypothetical protein
MNFFAHGWRFMDRPYFLAGTAVPDWLGACDRKTRVRRQIAMEWGNGHDPGGEQLIAAEIAAGIVQHLDDDRWFHRTATFVQTSAALTRCIRARLPDDRSIRPALLGHILTEVLLDAVLIERDSSSLDAYYEALNKVDADEVENAVNQMCRTTTERLAPWIHRFRQERFLQNYLDDAKLVFRMNQVLGRVELPTLGDDFIDLVPELRTRVAAAADALLKDH